MVFSSVVFLFAFLPVVFLVYRLLPTLKWKNLFLVAASLVFYAYGEPVYVLLMLFSSAMNYALGLFAAEDGRWRKAALSLAVVLNLSFLCVFKYTGFILENVNALLDISLPLPAIVMPIGISFFTFQALSYVIDVYRGDVRPQKDYGKVLLYISFFPQLIAGPIVKYHDIEREIEERQQTSEGVARGIRRFIIGLSKKVLVSNTMGLAADYVFGLPAAGLNIASAWIGALSYALQIYFDFSGYSDMAIGLGEMFGFHFRENFQYPYYGDSVQDFWRRWHISLSTWFKEYLYIPLGGNRKGKVRTYINKIIVFFCTGLWHGAQWTFVLWGLIHGAFLILEDTILPVKKCRVRWLRQFYTVLVAVLAFVIFRAEDMGQAGLMFGMMFTGLGMTPENVSNCMSILDPLYLATLAAALIGAMPVKRWLEEKEAAWMQAGSYAVSVALLLLCICRLAADAYNPFIYFRF